MNGALHVELVHAATPPSFNEYRTAHWRKAQRIKKDWQEIMETLLMVSRVARGPWRFVEASAALRFPKVRRRDEGNFRTTIEKSLGDALVNGGWLGDDTPDQFRMRAVTFDPVPGPARTTLMLTFLGHQ